jgi:hypothetical protein
MKVQSSSSGNRANEMMAHSPRSSFKRNMRSLLVRAVGRYGYQLVHTGQVDERAFEMIPRGQVKPFSTTEYDVVPRDSYDLVIRDYYSPIPDLSLLPEDIWLRRSDLRGVELDAERAIQYVERELNPAIAELDVPLDDPGEPGVFFLRNSRFESVDAELLYAMIRTTRPNNVLELGSGYSTLLINMAARRNISDGMSTQHTVYDPYPCEHILGSSLPEPTVLETVSATDVPLEAFERLGEGDVLFVDTTHTVKLGSDVNFIILEVLPRLQPGVMIHFHDVFLPWEYPREWFERMHYYWTEQYLLHAFLAFNSAFTILVPASAVAREYPRRLGQVIPTFQTGVMPGSIWLVNRGT